MTRIPFFKEHKKHDIRVGHKSFKHMATIPLHLAPKVASAEDFKHFQVAPNRHPLHMNRNSKYRRKPQSSTAPVVSKPSERYLKSAKHGGRAHRTVPRKLSASVTAAELMGSEVPSVRLPESQNRRNQATLTVPPERPRALSIGMTPQRSSRFNPEEQRVSSESSRKAELFMDEPTDTQVIQRPTTLIAPNKWKWGCKCPYSISMRKKNRRVLGVDLAAASSKSYKAFEPEDRLSSPVDSMFPRDGHPFANLPVTPVDLSRPEAFYQSNPAKPTWFGFHAAAFMNHKTLMEAPYDPLGNIPELNADSYWNIAELATDPLGNFPELQGAPTFNSTVWDPITLPEFDFEDKYNFLTIDSSSSNGSISAEFSQNCKEALDRCIGESSDELLSSPNPVKETYADLSSFDWACYEVPKNTPEIAEVTESLSIFGFQLNVSLSGIKWACFEEPKRTPPEITEVTKPPSVFGIQIGVSLSGIDISAQVQVPEQNEPASSVWTASSFLKTICCSEGEEHVDIDLATRAGESARKRRYRARAYDDLVRRKVW
jgi:hypothetical protein